MMRVYLYVQKENLESLNKVLTDSNNIPNEPILVSFEPKQGSVMISLNYGQYVWLNDNDLINTLISFY